MTDVDVEALQRLIRSLKDERDELSQWKAEALPVLAGLQDLGHALGVPLGQRITGDVAAHRAKELRAAVARVEALADKWSDPSEPLGIIGLPWANDVREALAGDQP